MYTQEQKKLINEVLEEISKNVYTLKFQAIQDFKEKHNLNEPMFEVGKCYKSERGSVVCFTGNVDEINIGGYGILSDGYYYNDNFWNKNIYTTEIPREEFNKMLLEYAEKKYPKGTKVKCLSDGKEQIVNILEFGRTQKNTIFSYEGIRAVATIFDDGKFAEIIEEVEQPTIILKVPKGSNYRVEEV